MNDFIIKSGSKMAQLLFLHFQVTPWPNSTSAFLGYTRKTRVMPWALSNPYSLLINWMCRSTGPKTWVCFYKRYSQSHKCNIYLIDNSKIIFIFFLKIHVIRSGKEIWNVELSILDLVLHFLNKVLKYKYYFTSNPFSI